MRAMCLVVALFCGNYQLCPLMKSTATIRHAFNMVLEVHGMASVRLQPLPHLISGTLTNGFAGNGDLNNFARCPV